MQRRRKSCLGVSQQQQNEYTESTTNSAASATAATRNTSVSDLNSVISAEFQESESHHFYYETAIRRTVGWVAAAIGFGTALGFFAGSQTSEEFFAGYLLEQSLSIDNLLVFLLLFEYFRIPLENQNRILNWGIVGAIVMRATMIGAGAIAIQKFRAVLLLFAAILIFSSAKVIFGSVSDDEDDTEDLSENQIVKFSNSVINSTDQFDGDRFFTEIDGGIRKATPMLLCMIAVEISDVVFAIDSIPAVFGVTEVYEMTGYCLFAWS
jgi:TerC family integral membrane protein